VSKTHPAEKVLELYNAGHRIFGENKVQELCQKYEQLPKDIDWHLIGHLQTNKVKYIAPFVNLIHAVDSEKLLLEISKQAQKCGREIEVLMQIHIAKEETKFGFDLDEARQFLSNVKISETFPNVLIKGLMAMASNVDDDAQVASEFSAVKSLFDELRNQNLDSKIQMQILSMGMSGDYELAMNNGSNMVRVGSSIFGSRV
jgi:pyridoxal phosphate enzyme (YggS family)